MFGTDLYSGVVAVGSSPTAWQVHTGFGSPQWTSNPTCRKGLFAICLFGCRCTNPMWYAVADSLGKWCTRYIPCVPPATNPHRSTRQS